jgi:hypothetical protein
MLTNETMPSNAVIMSAIVSPAAAPWHRHHLITAPSPAEMQGALSLQL